MLLRLNLKMPLNIKKSVVMLIERIVKISGIYVITISICLFYQQLWLNISKKNKEIGGFYYFSCLWTFPALNGWFSYRLQITIDTRGRSLIRLFQKKNQAFGISHCFSAIQTIPFEILIGGMWKSSKSINNESTYAIVIK